MRAPFAGLIASIPVATPVFSLSSAVRSSSFCASAFAADSAIA